jgi:hypothetical protein
MFNMLMPSTQGRPAERFQLVGVGLRAYAGPAWARCPDGSCTDANHPARHPQSISRAFCQGYCPRQGVPPPMLPDHGAGTNQATATGAGACIGSGASATDPPHDHHRARGPARALRSGGKNLASGGRQSMKFYTPKLLLVLITLRFVSKRGDRQ